MDTQNANVVTGLSIETSPSCSPLRAPIFRRLSLGRRENPQDWPEDKSPAVKCSRSEADALCQLVEAEITWTPELEDKIKAAESSNTSSVASRSTAGKFACSRRLHLSVPPELLEKTSLNVTIGTRTESVRSVARIRNGDSLSKSQELSSSIDTSDCSQLEVIPSSLKEELLIAESEVHCIPSKHASSQSIKTLGHVSSNDEIIANSLSSSKQGSFSFGLETYESVSGSGTSLSETLQLSEDESSNDLAPAVVSPLLPNFTGQAALDAVAPPHRTSRQMKRRKVVKGGLVEQFQHWANQQSSHLNIWLYKLRSMTSDNTCANSTVEYKLKSTVKEFNCVRCFCDVCSDDQTSCAIIMFDADIFAHYALKLGDSFALLPPYNREIISPGSPWPIVVGPMFIQPKSTINT
ncbi:hypothetical protein M514_02775 [Trichuris suis]|uniref:Uncharacterized protein n=1 Tax=Trichuris suis TaxID=68888 RepID=A0A085NH01_9BILA|nr:hypothetical protein M514_02775 [Trichuris suis]